MEMSFIASFWLVSFLLIITPGADWAYTITRDSCLATCWPR